MATIEANAPETQQETPETITASTAAVSYHERLFPRLTHEQKERAAHYGMGVALNPGDILFSEGEPNDGIFIVLEGEVKISRRAPDGETVLVVHRPGEFTGEQSTLTGGDNIATGRAVGPARVTRLSADGFKKMLSEERDIREVVVPAMLQRRSEADRQVQEREKLSALGRLAAGLAHEVNNPASAARSAVQEMERTLDSLLLMALDAGRKGMTVEEAKRLEAFRHSLADEAKQVTALNPLARADRENALIDWLDEHAIDNSWELGPGLVDSGATVEALGDLAGTLSESCLPIALGYIASTSNAQSLLSQINEATGRIVALVKTVKDYSYMDQAAQQEVDINEGIRTTVSLFTQLKKDIAVEMDLSPNCPPINAYGGQLNQVWTNLLINATDAVRERRERDGAPGRIRVTTFCEFDQILVSIEDNGTGIPSENLSRLFEPFFTTKGPGKGTGLGLDIAYRIVVGRHGGDIRVQSVPGHTRFEVRLPTGFPPPSVTDFKLPSEVG